MSVDGENVYLNEDGSVSFLGELTVDGDGSPRCYGPPGTKPLDFLANAGNPGNWWGIATDSKGIPIIQGKDDPYPGYYVSTTALKNKGFKHGDPRREIDSEKVPFIVVPSPLIKKVRGVVLGSQAKIIDTRTGKFVMAVVADIGPAKHLGEASIAAAVALGLSGNPKSGGSSKKAFEYIFWPGTPAQVNGITYPLQPS